MSDFKKRVLNFVNKIPKGKVVSYGQVAAVAGSPRAARQVGGILRSSEAKVPWWRVVNSKGIISIKSNWTATKALQRALLLKDGVKVSQDFSLDIKQYQFKN